MENLKHFTLQELTFSTTAQALGYTNMPNFAEVENLYMLATLFLEPIRKYCGFPIHVNSGYRSARINAEVGGVATSAHIYGRAADIRGNSPEQTRKIEKAVMVLGLPFDQLIIYGDYRFIHLGIAHAASDPFTISMISARKQVLRK